MHHIVRSHICSRRLTLLLVGCASMLTCQAGGGPGAVRVGERPGDEAFMPFEPQSGGEWQGTDSARRALAEAGRIDAATSRMAVSSESTSGGRTVIRVDRIVIGEGEWLDALLKRAGIVVRVQGEMLILDADDPGGLRPPIRRLLRDVNEAIERVRGNVVAQRRVGHRANVDVLETMMVDPSSAGDDAEESATYTEMSQGPLVETDQPLDIAIYGRGLLAVDVSSEGPAIRRYTRDGRLCRSASGALALRASPDAILSPVVSVSADVDQIVINPDGTVLVRRKDHESSEAAGRIRLSWFEHAERLAVGSGGLLVAGTDIGEAQTGFPLEDDLGEIIQGRLELSNADATKAWSQLCRLEDARQLLLAMVAELKGKKTTNAVASRRHRPRGRGDSADETASETIVIPFADPPIGCQEPALVEFLKSQEIGFATIRDGIEVRRTEIDAAALAEYLRLLRKRLDDVVQRVAATNGAPTPEPDEESLELNMAEADAISSEYDVIKHALCAMGDKAVGPLVKLLGDGPPVILPDAAWVLGKIGTAASPAIPALVECLSSVDGRLRRAAATALQRIAPGSRPVVESIVDMWIASLHGTTRSERYHAAIALGRLGEAASPAVPILAARVEDPTSGAAVALGLIGTAASAAVPALTKALSLPTSSLRLQAAQSLGRMGPAARSAVPTLVTLFGDREKGVRQAALEAVGWIGSDEAAHVDAIAALLREKDSDVRDMAAATLARLAPTNERARNLLFARTADDEDPQLRSSTVGLDTQDPLPRSVLGLVARVDVTSRLMLCDILAMLGRLGRPGVGLLTKLAQDSREPVACAAMDAIGSFGGAAREALPILALSLQHESPFIRLHAVRALGLLGVEAAIAVPALCGRLDDGQEGVVVATIDALGRIGPAAADSIPLLRSLNEHPSPLIREAVCQALNRICAGEVLTQAPGEVNGKTVILFPSPEAETP